MDVFYTASILAIALAGAILCVYIFFTKRLNVPLVCPIHGSCDVVIHSEYSKFFGIPLELLGFFYYAAIAGTYAWMGITGSPTSALPLLYASGIAFLFSLYLTGLQAFVIKHWCTWCLTSAAFCALILSLSLAKYFL